jgi:hypothetical protein
VAGNHDVGARLSAFAGIRLLALLQLDFMQVQPFINIPVSNASRCFFTPRQTSILNPGIRVSGSTARAIKEYIIFPKLNISPAGNAFLQTNIPGLEIGRIHSRASFLH